MSSKRSFMFTFRMFSLLLSLLTLTHSVYGSSSSSSSYSPSTSSSSSKSSSSLLYSKNFFTLNHNRFIAQGVSKFVPLSVKSHHHHWSIDNWWNAILEDDQEYRTQKSINSLNFFSKSVHDHVNSNNNSNNNNDNNDPLEMSASEDQAIAVNENDQENNKLKQEEQSAIIDVTEPNAMIFHNRSALLKIKKSSTSGLTNNEVWKTYSKFSSGRGENDIPIKRGDTLFYSPKTTSTALKSQFNEYFLTIRSNLPEYEALFNEVKLRLEKRLQILGLPTKRQFFYYPEYKTQKRKGQNLIAVLKGTNVTGNSNIIILGAHYDTVPGSMGTEDNASGSVAILEVARLLKTYRCKLDSTIYFVFFDMEEDGLIGSRAFVRDYLVPFEIEEAGSNIQGAFIIDMLLQYDDTPDKQHTSVLGKLSPNFLIESQKNQNRANFAAAWARSEVPEEMALWSVLSKNWQNKQKYKLMSLKNKLPMYGHNLTDIIRSPEFRSYSTFLRSDHSNFWYPSSQKERTIPAILLTDLGPWRDESAKRYHTSNDNARLLTRKNVAFLKNSIDSLIRTVLELGKGECLSTLIQTARQTRKLLKPFKVINATRGVF